MLGTLQTSSVSMTERASQAEETPQWESPQWQAYKHVEERISRRPTHL